MGCSIQKFNFDNRIIPKIHLSIFTHSVISDLLCKNERLCGSEKKNIEFIWQRVYMYIVKCGMCIRFLKSFFHFIKYTE